MADVKMARIKPGLWLWGCGKRLCPTTGPDGRLWGRASTYALALAAADAHARTHEKGARDVH